MSSKTGPEKVQRVFAGLALLACSPIVGAVAGVSWVKLFVPRKAMGWDGLADILGGLMIGALAGLLVGAVLVALLSVRAQWVAAGVAVISVVLALVVISLTAPEPKVSPMPITKQAFQPFFRLGLGVSHTREILAAVPPGERPFPFVEVKVSSGKPELILVGWGPEFERCVATPSEEDLENLLPRLQAVVAASGPYCRSPEDDLHLSANWRLAGVSGGQGLEAGCLPEQESIRELAEAIGVMADRLCPASVAGTGSF